MKHKLKKIVYLKIYFIFCKGYLSFAEKIKLMYKVEKCVEIYVNLKTINFTLTNWNFCLL